MRDGYWINYKTGREFKISEHEDWIRDPKNARKLGLSKKLIEQAFPKFKPKRDRDKFLTFLMKHAPIMRVRGHGSYVTFEYASRSRRKPVDAIWGFADENLGPFSTMYINNLETGEGTTIMFHDFEEVMDRSGPEGLMRVAEACPVLPEVVEELERIAEELGFREPRLAADFKEKNRNFRRLNAVVVGKFKRRGKRSCHWTVRELAEEAGVPPGSVVAWAKKNSDKIGYRKGRYNPSGRRVFDKSGGVYGESVEPTVWVK